MSEILETHYPGVGKKKRIIFTQGGVGGGKTHQSPVLSNEDVVVVVRTPNETIVLGEVPKNILTIEQLNK